MGVANFKKLSELSSPFEAMGISQRKNNSTSLICSSQKGVSHT